MCSQVRLLEGDWISVTDLLLGEAWLEADHWRHNLEGYLFLPRSSLLFLPLAHHDVSSFPLPDSSIIPFYLVASQPRTENISLNKSVL